MSCAVRLALALAIVLAALASLPVHAHELQPGFLELRETAPGRYEVLWKLPSLGESSDVGMPIAPVFPDTCRPLGEARTERAGTAWVFNARIECTPGLAGQTIGIDGLDAFATDVLVRVQHADGGVETLVLKPVLPSVTLRAVGDTRRGVGGGMDALGGHSLAMVCERELGVVLDKSSQTSNWSRRPLDMDQIRYAALDAEVLLALHDHFAQALPAPVFESATQPAREHDHNIEGTAGSR